MKASRILGVSGVAILILTATPLAVAQDSGWYIGANIGQSRAKIDNSQITRNLLGEGFAVTSLSNDDRTTGYKLFGGYQFNKYFALEGGYFDLGTFGFSAATLPPGTLNGSARIKGLNLDAVGFLPFTQSFSAFGRVGLDYAQARDSFTGTGFVNVLNANPSTRNTYYKFGVGLQYALTQSFALRAEVERYRVNDAIGNKGDIDLVSLGLVYSFAKPAAPAETAAASPAETVVAAPVPTPAPITRQYCSSLDIQFEINQSDIQRGMQEKLRVLGTFMSNHPETTAVIEGNTDNVGTPQANMKLSQDRAQSVVSYLVNSFAIAPSRLKAVGYGDTHPIADNSTDAGRRLNRRIEAVIPCVTDVTGLAVMPARLTTLSLPIEFGQNQADVKPQYRDDLRQVADFLKANQAVVATVEGNTDNLQPTAEIAMKISQLRAQNVVNYLVDNFGIARSRLTAVGFGQTRRFAYNTSVAGRQQNRRVNVIFSYPSSN